jgi:hypothetical protein
MIALVSVKDCAGDMHFGIMKASDMTFWVMEINIFYENNTILHLD